MPFNDCCIYFSLLFTVSKKSTKSVQRKIVILNSAATVTTWQTSDNYVFCNFYVKKYDLSCLNYALFCCSCSGASATNELRPLRAVLSCCLRWATCNMCLLHLLLHSSSPCVLGGLPLLLCPCGFHWTTVLVILLLGPLGVCPINVHLLFSKISADFCFVAKSSFLILCDHLIARILEYGVKIVTEQSDNWLHAQPTLSHALSTFTRWRLLSFVAFLGRWGFLA